MAAKVALITGADRGLGLALCRGLLEKGWRVLAGQYMPEWLELAKLAQDLQGRLTILPLDVSSPHSVQEASRIAAESVQSVDILISNAGINTREHERTIRQEPIFDDMIREYNVNALGPLRTVQAFLPLLDRGDLKRIAFVSSEAGSIGASERLSWFGYCMSKAALNMAAKNLSNDLGREGYDIRVYHPGWMKSYISGEVNPSASLDLDEAASVALRYFLDAPKEEPLCLRDWEGNRLPW